ncbi:MAG: DUF6516 family protein [Methanobacteriota archaeon]
MYSWIEGKRRKIKESKIIADDKIHFKFERNTAFIRGTLIFVDGSILRFMEFIDMLNKLHRYRFQWMDSKNYLIRRWDNAPHHKEISSFPHHTHIQGKSNPVASRDITLEEVLDFIEGEILIRR